MSDAPPPPAAAVVRGSDDPRRGDGPATDETCDHCGSTDLGWRKCKLICGNCSQIMKSCADL